jgi:hypothetical protein
MNEKIVVDDHEEIQKLLMNQLIQKILMNQLIKKMVVRLKKKGKKNGMD